MGTSSWSGSGSEGYTTNSSGSGLSPWIGWGISTLLLFLLNRNSGSGSTSSQQPSKFTQDNVNCIGQPVPVVLGRCMIKNPLISYYGDFSAEPYTEEYGMHSSLDAKALLWPFLLSIIAALLMPSQHKTQDTDTHGDTGYGTATDTDNGRKFDMLVNALLSLLISLLMWLFNRHAGRTTIQKGFLYYLGWQHIICWTGRNTGIGKIYMNEYNVFEPPKVVKPNFGFFSYSGLDLSHSISISTTLYKGGGINPFLSSAIQTPVNLYYDINNYASDSDVLSLGSVYFNSENKLLTYILDNMSKNPNIACIIALQGYGVRTFSKNFYETISKKMELVIWHLDSLPLKEINSISDEAFNECFSSINDTSEDEQMVEWLRMLPNTHYLDVRKFIHGYISEIFGSNIATAYKEQALNDYYYILGDADLFTDTACKCPLPLQQTMVHTVGLTHLDEMQGDITSEEKINAIFEQQHIEGYSTYIDNKDLFGGYDEGGGFTGELRFYFGNREQPKDPWMIHSMQASTIDEELRGLTPKYPMYLTCVVSNSSMNGGAYIGKQATIPEMWFEVFNYPDRLGRAKREILVSLFEDDLLNAYKIPVEFMESQDSTVQEYMLNCMEDLDTAINNFKEAVDNFLGLPFPSNYPSQLLLDDIYDKADAAYNRFPSTDREGFGATLVELKSLCESGIYHLGYLDDDLNPAEAIYEILMNKYWGCGYTDDRIDINSLMKLGILCEKEHLGISCLINRTAQANDYITKILNHINGVKYDDPKTGKLTFKLIRNDYDVDKIKSFDVSNTESCEFSRLDWSETTSAVEITFTDASNKYDTGQFTFTDIANRLITGFYTSKSVEGDYFTTTANAKWLAQMNQLANGYPLSAINLVTNRYAYDVTIGDPIKVSWEPYGLNQIVFRVTDIDYANLTEGKISITGVEDVFGFDKLDFTVSESPQWTDPEEVPTSIGRYAFIEEPYETSRGLTTYIFAYAAQPTEKDVYWDVWRNKNGTYVKSSQSMAWSTVGRLTYGYLKGFDVDNVGFEISALGQNGSELIDQKIERITTYPTTYTATSGLNLLVIDNEWMAYESIEQLPNGHYQVKGVIRGIFDTLPQQHTAESIVFFIENRQNIAGTGNSVANENDPSVTEYVELRTETRNVAQPFEPSLVEEYTTTRRAEQPSVMANMQFGADMGSETTYAYDYTTSTIFSGGLVFKFKGRNKFNNYGVISQVDTETNIIVAEDTKNVLQTHSQNIDGEWKTTAMEKTVDEFGIVTYFNVETDELSWEKFCEVMGDKVQYQNTVILDVLTYNSTKELYSYDKYEKSIDWRTPRFVGVVADQAEAQTLADSYIMISGNNIVVPSTTVSPQLSLLYTECPILIEGIQVTGTSSVNDIMCQDGNMYRLSNNAYRIVGKDENNNAILYPFTIDEYYIMRSDFTQLVSNYADYWQYNGTNWVKYIIL